jgi:hypothetical protein
MVGVVLMGVALMGEALMGVALMGVALRGGALTQPFCLSISWARWTLLSALTCSPFLFSHARKASSLSCRFCSSSSCFLCSAWGGEERGEEERKEAVKKGEGELGQYSRWYISLL